MPTRLPEWAVCAFLALHQAGDDETRIGLARQVFRLADHPAFTGPGLAHAITKVAEAPGRLSAILTGSADLFHFLAQRPLQALVERQTQDTSAARL